MVVAIRLAALAATVAVSTVPAFAYSKPPTSSTPPASSSSGGSPSTGGPASIPEPAAIGLFALGIAGAALIRRRQRRKQD